MAINFLILTKKELLRLLASFILGLIIGAISLNLIVGPKLDSLIFENKSLTKQVDEQKNRLTKLEDSLAQEKNEVIKNIEIKFTSEIDKHISQALEEEVFAIIKTLIGKEIKKIDPEPLIKALDQRIVKINESEYKLNLVWSIFQQETIVYFEIVD